MEGIAWYSDPYPLPEFCETGLTACRTRARHKTDTLPRELQRRIVQRGGVRD
jgi:hypothetical protein